MNIKFRKFQEGGPVEAAPAPAAQGGGDPMQMLLELANQALQGQDCNAAMQVCEILLQVVQQAQGGGAPAPTEGEPVFRKGGILTRRV